MNTSAITIRNNKIVPSLVFQSFFCITEDVWGNCLRPGEVENTISRKISKNEGESNLTDELTKRLFILLVATAIKMDNQATVLLVIISKIEENNDCFL